MIPFYSVTAVNKKERKTGKDITDVQLDLSSTTEILTVLLEYNLHELFC